MLGKVKCHTSCQSGIFLLPQSFHQSYLFKWAYSLLLLYHLCFQKSQLRFLSPLLDFWDFFLDCVCGLSVILICFYTAVFGRVEGVVAFWVEMVYMLKPLALSVWLCVYIARLTLRYCFSSSWRRRMQCRCLVLLSVLHVTCTWRTCLDWLYILFTLTFHLYLHKTCMRQ